MTYLEILYNIVSDGNKPIWERKDAVSKIGQMNLDNDVIKALSDVAKNTAFPLQIRSMASSSLFKHTLKN